MIACTASCQEETMDGDSSCKSLFINAPSASLKLIWKNVTYKIQSYNWTDEFPFYRAQDKLILSNCSGSASSGALTAIIGPSGAGKSTLLKILSGRKETGVTGHVYVNHDLPFKKMIKVTFMSQTDEFCQNLTVRETLTFAFKLMQHEVQKRVDKDTDPPATVDHLLEDLKLTSCANVKVSRCSGGQVKRLSIACELVSPPNIMLLDEPSSGLDSNCALQVMQMLKKAAIDKNIVIIASIHQPNGKIVSLIDNLYVLTHNGRNIYRSSADSLGKSLSSFGVDIPAYCNPTDVVLDIAAGQFNADVLKAMLESQVSVSDNNNNSEDSFSNSMPMSKIFNRMMTRSLPVFSHMWIIFCRSLILTLRDPMLFVLSFLQHIAVALVAGLIYTNAIGSFDGCYKEQYINPLMFTSKTTQLIAQENLYTFSSLTLILINVIFLFMSTVSATALTFPLEVKVFMKEKTNRWYSCLAYYVGRTLADAPFRIVFPVIYSVIIYKLTGQPDDWYRISMFSLINVSFAFMAQAVGMLFSSIFINSIAAAAFNGCVSVTPFLLLGGFLVSVNSMPPWAQSLSTVSYFRYMFEASVSTIYGMNRCLTALQMRQQLPVTPFSDLHNTLMTNNLTYNSMFRLFKTYLRAQDVDEDVSAQLISKIRLASNATKEIFRDIDDAKYPGRSYVLDTFDVPEFYVWFPIGVILLYFLLFKIIAYVILLQRSTPRK